MPNIDNWETKRYCFRMGNKEAIDQPISAKTRSSFIQHHHDQLLQQFLHPEAVSEALAWGFTPDRYAALVNQVLTMDARAISTAMRTYDNTPMEKITADQERIDELLLWVDLFIRGVNKFD